MKKILFFLFMVVATVAVMAQYQIPTGAVYQRSFQGADGMYDVYLVGDQELHICRNCPKTPAPLSPGPSTPVEIPNNDLNVFMQGQTSGVALYERGLNTGLSVSQQQGKGSNMMTTCNGGHGGCYGGSSCNHGGNNSFTTTSIPGKDPYLRAAKVAAWGSFLGPLIAVGVDQTIDRFSGSMNHTNHGWNNNGTQWSHPGNNGSGWSQFQQTDWQPVGTGSTGWTGTASPQIPSGTSWTH